MNNQADDSWTVNGALLSVRRKTQHKEQPCTPCVQTVRGQVARRVSRVQLRKRAERARLNSFGRLNALPAVREGAQSMN